MHGKRAVVWLIPFWLMACGCSRKSVLPSGEELLPGITSYLSFAQFQAQFLTNGVKWRETSRKMDLDKTNLVFALHITAEDVMLGEHRGQLSTAFIRDRLFQVRFRPENWRAYTQQVAGISRIVSASGGQGRRGNVRISGSEEKHEVVAYDDRLYEEISRLTWPRGKSGGG